MDIAQENKEPSYVMRAFVYLAREEIYAKTPMAIQALEKAESEAKKFQPNQELNIIFKKLHTTIESNRETFNMAQNLALPASHYRIQATENSELKNISKL